MGQKSQRLGVCSRATGYARIQPLTCQHRQTHENPRPTQILVSQELEEFPSDPGTYPSPSAALCEINEATYKHEVQASLKRMLLPPQCPKRWITRVHHQAWLGALLFLQHSPQGKWGGCLLSWQSKGPHPQLLGSSSQVNEGSLHTPRASQKRNRASPQGDKDMGALVGKRQILCLPSLSFQYRTLHKLDKCPTLSNDTKPFALFILSQGLTKLPRLTWLELALWHRQPRTWDLPVSAS